MSLDGVTGGPNGEIDRTLVIVHPQFGHGAGRRDNEKEDGWNQDASHGLLVTTVGEATIHDIGQYSTLPVAYRH